MKNIYLTLIMGIFAFSSFSQDIPEGYYDGTEDLTSEDLKLKLHQIIRGHVVYTYGDFRDTILPDLDEDPDNSDNIILMYKGTSIPKENFASNSEQDYWNREHTWPKSHGFADDTDTAYTDVHNLRPSDASVNTSKSNKDFNELEHTADNEEGEAADTYTDSDFFEPRDAIKGDVARILFYMDTRYESKSLDLELVDRSSYSGDPEFGVLYTLLKWHEEDPVSDEEISRHEGAYGYQGNRNPFIDHPEWVAEVYGDVTGPLLLVDDYGFSQDFGNVVYEDTLTQDLDLNAYNLSGDVTVSTNAPFYISDDGENFTSEVTFAHEDGATEEEFSLYIMFVPADSDGETYSDTISFTSTDAKELKLAVTGQEGEASVITIAQARERDLETVVTITGVVIDAGNNSTRNRIIYDGSAGIVVRSDDDDQTADLVQGDSVVVSGGLSDYYDLLEVNEAPISVSLISQGATLPEAQEVTINEIGELYESELVVIRDVTFSAAGDTFAYGNWTIKDGTGSLILRIGSDDHPLVGETIPSGTYDITGYIGQYNSDYQLFIRDGEDLVEVGSETEDLELISIAEARSMEEGDMVKVKGIIIGGENNNNYNRVLFDGTAGLVVRNTESGNESSALYMGDSVLVTGGIVDYYGLFELNESVELEILSSDNSLPEAQSITISDIGEEYESELIVLTGVSISETGTFGTGDYTITDGSNEITLRIGLSSHPLVGTTIPEGTFDFVGYVGENSDGYLVYTRTADDISLVETTLGVTAKEQTGLIYPNPTRDYFSLRLESGVGAEGKIDLSIYNMEGKLIKLIERSDLTNIDVSDLSKGVYLLGVTSEEINVYSRLIVK